jgi:hypothetical protein
VRLRETCRLGSTDKCVQQVNCWIARGHLHEAVAVMAHEFAAAIRAGRKCLGARAQLRQLICCEMKERRERQNDIYLCQSVESSNLILYFTIIISHYHRVLERVVLFYYILKSLLLKM